MCLSSSDCLTPSCLTPPADLHLHTTPTSPHGKLDLHAYTYRRHIKVGSGPAPATPCYCTTIHSVSRALVQNQKKNLSVLCIRSVENGLRVIVLEMLVDLLCSSTNPLKKKGSTPRTTTFCLSVEAEGLSCLFCEKPPLMIRVSSPDPLISPVLFFCGLV